MARMTVSSPDFASAARAATTHSPDTAGESVARVGTGVDGGQGLPPSGAEAASVRIGGGTGTIVSADAATGTVAIAPRAEAGDGAGRFLARPTMSRVRARHTRRPPHTARRCDADAVEPRAGPDARQRMGQRSRELQDRLDHRSAGQGASPGSRTAPDGSAPDPSPFRQMVLSGGGLVRGWRCRTRWGSAAQSSLCSVQTPLGSCNG